MANIETLHQRANEALINGDKARAEQIYNEIIEQVPNDEVALAQLMDLYFDTDRFRYYIARANYNIAQGKLEHAINDTKKAMNLEPQSIEANTKLARLYKVSKKNLKAIDQFNRILELDHNNQEPYRELIGLYLEEDSVESAIATSIKAVEIFKNNKDLKNILAKLYFDEGEYQKALEIVEDKILKIKILLQDSKNDEARALLDSYRDGDGFKKGIDTEQKAAYYLLEAQYFYNKNDYENALNSVNHYVEIKSPDAVSFQMKALIYEGLNDDFNACFNWGFCNKVRARYDEAIVEFNHAFSFNPKDKQTLIELAQLYEGNGEKFTAIEFWQKVYNIDEDKKAKEILGEFYYSQGDYKLAEKYGKIRQQKDIKAMNYNGPEAEDEGLLEKIIGIFSKK